MVDHTFNSPETAQYFGLFSANILQIIFLFDIAISLLHPNTSDLVSYMQGMQEMTLNKNYLSDNLDLKHFLKRKIHKLFSSISDWSKFAVL